MYSWIICVHIDFIRTINYWLFNSLTIKYVKLFTWIRYDFDMIFHIKSLSRVSRWRVYIMFPVTTLRERTSLFALVKFALRVCTLPKITKKKIFFWLSILIKVWSCWSSNGCWSVKPDQTRIWYFFDVYCWNIQTVRTRNFSRLDSAFLVDFNTN